ncbi:unnamed protein product [Dibothriocephalus latus]|uniref:Purple acid phosphatase n=1 Tax=Dibothriocephalus latus TaxID=60516 RepID=A0A3P6SIH7_DIBLA|nr:unnamed protein product [Dibothriocephalus latus]
MYESTETFVLTWVTQSATQETTVLYGVERPENVVHGTQTTFTDGGKEQRKTYVHSVTLSDLKPDTQYVYTVGSDVAKLGNPDHWSSTFKFRTMPSGSNWTLRFAMLGDMGVENAVSLPTLEKDVTEDKYHMVIHNGDFAYDMDDDNGRVGDKFMNLIQNIATTVPYMTSVGNHEEAYINVGPVHFISFSAEFYYFLHYGTEQIVRQFTWLEKDLREANKPENRAKHPWIIAFSHRPMYCSNSDDTEHCPNPENRIRVGFPIVNGLYRDYVLGLEKLFFEQGVDVIFAAHEHSYERCYPVFNLKVCNASAQDPYDNPTAPVHIVSGSAGCKEGEDPFVPNPQPWSAFQSDDYGYTSVVVHNVTHLELEQFSVEGPEPVIIDKMMLKKSHPRIPFSCNAESLEMTADWHYTSLGEILEKTIFSTQVLTSGK